MKKSILLAVLVAAASAVFADSSDLVGKSVVVLNENYGVYEKKSETEMKYAKDIENGAVVQVSGVKVADRLKKGGKDADMEFLEISYSKGTYYIPSFCIVEKTGEVNIVADECAVYGKHRLSSALPLTLKSGIFVVIIPEEGPNKEFSQYPWSLKRCWYFDRNAWKIQKGWIRSDKITNREADMKAFKLMKKAANEKDETIRDEIFSNIETLDLSGPVKAAYTKLKQKFLPPDMSLTETCSMMGVINASEDDRINFRSAPGTNSVVRGRFVSRAEVRFFEKTVNEEVIGGQSGCWYHFLVNSNEVDAMNALEINEGAPEDERIADGWIFGAFINNISERWF